MLCVISRIALLGGDSNEYNTIYRFQYKKEITINFPNLQPRDYFIGTQERVRNSRGKRGISVRAFEGLLYKEEILSGVTQHSVMRL